MCAESKKNDKILFDDSSLLISLVFIVENSNFNIAKESLISPLEIQK